MARNPLPPGTHGQIKVYKVKNKQWRARCRYRDHAGRMHHAERYAPTKAQAERRLKEAVRDWTGQNDAGNKRMRELITEWLDEVAQAVASGTRSQTTLDRYQQRTEQWITPRIGELPAREVTTGVLSRLLATVRDETSAANAKTVRSALRGICGYAVIHGAMTINPVDGALRLESTREPGRALTSDQVFDLLTQLDASEHAAKHDLPDFVRLCVATGERIGEILGARWVDLDEDERLLTMGRNVVRTSEGLIVREGKTERSRRDIPLPEWCVAMLAERRAKMAPHDTEEPIFPSSTGTIREPSNIYSRAWGPFREQAGYQWVTFHTFRRTVATFLDDANLTARQIADVLGHAHPSMTQDVYMARYTPSRKSAEALDAVWQAHEA